MSDKKPYQRQKESILKLRKEGLSYNEIAKKLGCAKSTISYHCGAGNSEKNRVRSQGHNPLCKKVNHFRSRCTAEAYRTFRNKVKGFKGRFKRGTYARVNNISVPYTCKDVIKKIGDHPICYLTGRKIDLNLPSEYHLDHIIPTHKGGTNDLSNMGICCAEANQAKGALNLDEFYDICQEILEWKEKQD
jgi:hypothetical protein